ncbi:MAG: hypothetical protein UHM08_08820 [Bacteroidales bacterium]|nr:hypothetical protein [Bacteroidales bacterium]
MDLIKAGRPSRDYTNHRTKFSVTLYEGDLKYTKNGIDRKTGRTVGQHSLTAPIELHRILEIHEDSTPRYILLKPAEAESTKAVAKLLFNPDMTWKPDAQYTSKNRLPQEDCEFGTYPNRSATVEWFGKAVDEVHIVAENEAIAPYDYLEYVGFENGVDVFKKSDGVTNLMALANVEALASGVCPVLEGVEFYGAVKE